MRSEMMIVVRDVEKSSLWYQELLKVRGVHGGSEFEMLVDEDNLILMLHRAETDEHPALASPTTNAPGAGVLLIFRVEDVDKVFETARTMHADLVDAPHENPQARQREFSLRDPDGYALTVCGPGPVGSYVSDTNAS